ncbi:hypothetical protein ScPMuIL_012692 [Solemya velum]
MMKTYKCNTLANVERTLVRKRMGQQSSSGGGGYGGTRTRSGLNNHANQCNPNHRAYQGHTSGYGGSKGRRNMNNHANQMNPNNARFKGKK